MKYNVLCPVCLGHWLKLLHVTGRICSGCGGSGQVDNEKAEQIKAEITKKMISNLQD